MKDQETKNVANAPQISELMHYILFVLYIIFTISFSLALIPLPSVAVFSLMICVFTLGTLYSLRLNGKNKKNNFIYSHSAYIIKTFWRANILFAITSFIALLYILVAVDYTPLEPCISAATNAVNNGNVDRLSDIIKMCGKLLMEKNDLHIKVMGFVAFVPIFIYVLVRCGRGLTLLMRSQKIPNIKL